MRRFVLIALAGLAATAIAAPAANADFVYWANLGGTSIGRADTDGTGVDQSFITGAAGPCGVAVSATHVYWTNSNPPGSVGRANLDGTGVNQSFVPAIGTGSCGVAVNDTHVFWAAGGGGNTIGRANIDGSSPNDNFITGTEQPCGLTVNDTHVYWFHTSPNAIARANIDGTGAVDLFPISALACHLALNDSFVYWGGGNNAVGRAGLDGSAPNETFIGGLSSYACGGGVNSKYVFWSHGSGTTVGRANLDGSGIDDAFITGADGPCGVAVDVEAKAPSNAFTFGKVKRNKKKGTATLEVNVPGAGTLDLTGKGVKTQRPAISPPYARTKPVAAAGTVKLAVKPTGKKKKKLKRRGKVKVKANVTFTPTGGTAANQTKSIKLKRKLRR